VRNLLSEKLAELRKKRGLGQADLAEYLKITRQAYSSYETAKREMDFESLCKIAEFYSVTTDYLLGRYDIKPFLLDDDDEIDVIRNYRTLDRRGKDTIKANLTFEMSQTTKAEISKKSAM
jgi:transcriptional regulator with XRE-family HTH domain